MPMLPEQLLATARELVEQSGADERTAHVAWGESGFARFSNNVMTQSGAQAGYSVGVWTAFGTRHGGSSANQLDEDSLTSAVRRAEEVAGASEPDPEHMPLIEPPQEYLEIPSYYETTANRGPADRAKAVAEIVRVAREANLRAAGSVHTGYHWGAFANSTELSDAGCHSSADVSVTVVGDGFSGWAGADANDVTQIEPHAVAERARDLALLAKDPVDLDPGRYTVLLLPVAVQDLLGPLLWHLDARAADEGRSALRGLEGTQVAARCFTLRSDPACRATPGHRSHGDGTATRPHVFIDQGVLQTLPCSRFWAKKQGQELVYPPANILVEGADRSVEDLLSEIDHGLLVTRIWYVRDVDPMRLLLTGMTRDALLLIEKGEITRAVKHFRWNNSPLDVFKNIIALGKPERTNGQLLPPMVVGDFFMTSKTLF